MLANNEENKKLKVLEDGMAAVRQKMIELTANQGNGNSSDAIADLEALAQSLKTRLENVEQDLLVDLDGDGIPDIQ